MFDLAPDEDEDEGHAPELIEWAGIRAPDTAGSKQAREALKAAKFRIAERQDRFERAAAIRAGWDDEKFEKESLLIADEVRRMLADRNKAQAPESA